MNDDTLTRAWSALESAREEHAEATAKLAAIHRRQQEIGVTDLRLAHALGDESATTERRLAKARSELKEAISAADRAFVEYLGETVRRGTESTRTMAIAALLANRDLWAKIPPRPPQPLEVC